MYGDEIIKLTEVVENIMDSLEKITKRIDNLEQGLDDLRVETGPAITHSRIYGRHN